MGRAMVDPWFWDVAGKGSNIRFTCRNGSAGGARKVFSVGSFVNKLAMRGMIGVSTMLHDLLLFIVMGETMEKSTE